MKLNDTTVNKLEVAFAIGASVSEACYYADISRQTYYNWEKGNRKLKEKFDRLKELPILKARRTINDNLSNVETAKWFLEKKRKDEFGTKIGLEVESVGGRERDMLKTIVGILTTGIKYDIGNIKEQEFIEGEIVDNEKIGSEVID